MRISRPCYDKIHRCPGWIGGGPHFAKVDKCKNGYIQVYGYEDEDGWHERKLWKWRTSRCNKCDVVVLPYMIKNFSVFWQYGQLKRWISNVRYDYRHR